MNSRVSIFEDDTINQAVEILWNYLSVIDELRPSDAILVFGCVDLTVPRHAADLYLKGFAPSILVSGAMGKSATALFGRPESEMFFDELITCGVPESRILLERNATNTGENVLFGLKMLRDQGLSLTRLIFVSKPYHSKRCRATFRLHEPNLEIISSPPEGEIEDFIISSKEKLALKLVGEIDRLLKYPAMGLIALVEAIPRDVIEATELIRNKIADRS